MAKVKGTRRECCHPLIYSQNPPVIFVKTKKTAGTSTEAFLQKVLFGVDTLSMESTRPFRSEGAYVSARRMVPIASKDFNSHASLREVQDYFALDDLSDFDIVINVRKPLEQTVSFFWWDLMRQSRFSKFNLPGVASQLPFPILKALFHVWFGCTWKRIRNLNFSTLLSERKISPEKLHILRQENLTEDLERLCLNLHFNTSDVEVPALKSSIRVLDVPARLYFSKPLVKILARLRRPDAELFTAAYKTEFPVA